MQKPADNPPLTVRSTICEDCPFRRTAPPGWLGANDPESFILNAIFDDNSVGCHLQVNPTLHGAAWEAAESSAPRCRGAITVRRNMGKLPRNQRRADLDKTVAPDRETCFPNHLEFVRYHENAPVKSWRFREER